MGWRTRTNGNDWSAGFSSRLPLICRNLEIHLQQRSRHHPALCKSRILVHPAVKLKKKGKKNSLVWCSFLLALSRSGCGGVCTVRLL
jgi:hypothetical protein